MLDSSTSTHIRTTKRHLEKLEFLGIKTLRDLLTFFPRTYNDSSSYTAIVNLRVNEINTVRVKINSIFNATSKFGKKLTHAIASDQSGVVKILWFNQQHLTKMLHKGAEVVLTGKANFSQNKLTLISPSYEKIEAGKIQLHSGRIVPVYHETDGISSKWIREKIQPLLTKYIGYFNETKSKKIREKYQLYDLKTALTQIHFPDNSETLQHARRRLAFDELYDIQYKSLEKKLYWQQVASENVRVITSGTKELEEAINSLPFELTSAQKRVLNEIEEDMKKGRPMSRLVQGDVGSGKTIVAALAALKVVKNGYQVALMAPTEILAKQHYRNLVKTIQKFNLNIQFIAGSTKKSEKEGIIRQMKSGTVDIIIGTHALIQDGIGFKNLGLAIIDEQHRFGVKQREILKQAGSPHLLTMTATPIPRTLAITLYGDQDLSEIDEMPANRKEIITRIVPEQKRQDAYIWIKDQVLKGRQAFIICPLIDESDKLEVKSVTEEYQRLSEHIFPELQVSFLHGKLKQDEKDSIMEKFKNNEINILVSTSVIEVGIDVPNASIMIIEGAERFGLSQLHQFRGRVGRGIHQSYCFLFESNGMTTKNPRLKAMEKHSSGFKLSEIDLQLRGPGEVYGLKQSGIPDLKMASLTDLKTIKEAREAASQELNSQIA